MPYIKEERRQDFPETTGDLTYKLCRQLVTYYTIYGNKFDVYSRCIAALECAKLEFYRRMMAPYEDEKMKENGDAF